MRMCKRYLLAVTLATISLPAVAYQASLAVSPTVVTTATDAVVKVELTNDNLNPCDFEVRLIADYANITYFVRKDVGNKIVLGGALWPHLVPPMVPCVVPCIALAAPPYAVLAEVPLGRLRAGEYEIELTLPGLCDLPTPCKDVPIVRCDFAQPLRARFTVHGPASVDRRDKVSTTWARMKTARLFGSFASERAPAVVNASRTR
ncbi:hypothetical protein FJZ36_00115 [Candidatus Poribacteria bacterium]|nr:hypothetical protein [Candidatus Poribacteria bacterium]